VLAYNAAGTSGYSNVVDVSGEIAATPAASFVAVDTATAGDWKTRYGADGYNVIGDSAAYPAYATVTSSGHLQYTWESPSADPRALQRPGSSPERIAATWYADGEMYVDVDLTDGQTHRVALYMLDYDRLNRSQRIDVLDGNTGAVLATRQITDFAGGQYAAFDVTGKVRFRITRTGGINAVLSGVFFGEAPNAPTGASATFKNADDVTQGNWSGVLGGEGHNVLGDVPSYPVYADVQSSGHQSYTWETATQDPRALLRPGSATDRVAATWYTHGEMFVDVNLTDGQKHAVSMYMVDWDRLGRAQRVEVLDAATGQVLDSRDVSGFENGRYLTWELSGHVRLRVTVTGGYNAVVSGLFFDAAETGTATSATAQSPSVFSTRPIVAKFAKAAANRRDAVWA
jgi:hypothetical protein